MGVNTTSRLTRHHRTVPNSLRITLFHGSNISYALVNAPVDVQAHLTKKFFRLISRTLGNITSPFRLTTNSSQPFMFIQFLPTTRHHPAIKSVATSRRIVRCMGTQFGDPVFQWAIFLLGRFVADTLIGTLTTQLPRS